MVELALRRSPVVSETPWLRALPPAARLVLHGNAAARAAACPSGARNSPRRPAGRTCMDLARPYGSAPMSTCSSICARPSESPSRVWCRRSNEHSPEYRMPW